MLHVFLPKEQSLCWQQDQRVQMARLEFTFYAEQHHAGYYRVPCTGNSQRGEKKKKTRKIHKNSNESKHS